MTSSCEARAIASHGRVRHTTRPSRAREIGTQTYQRRIARSMAGQTSGRRRWQDGAPATARAGLPATIRPMLIELRAVGLVIAALIVLLAIYRSRRGAGKTTILVAVLAVAGLLTVAIVPEIVFAIRDFLGIGAEPLSGLSSSSSSPSSPCSSWCSRCQRASTTTAAGCRGWSAGLARKSLEIPDGLARPGIAIVLPSLNEADNLDVLLHRIPRQLGGLDVAAIVVDDGSTDGTPDIVRRDGAILISHPVNQGGGAALRLGYRVAWDLGAPIIVTMDADGQHDPDQLDRLVEPIIDGRADFVIGSRLKGDHEAASPIRHLGIYLFNGLISRPGRQEDHGLFQWVPRLPCDGAPAHPVVRGSVPHERDHPCRRQVRTDGSRRSRSRSVAGIRGRPRSRARCATAGDSSGRSGRPGGADIDARPPAVNSTGRVVGVAFAILYLAFGVLFVSPRLSADGAAYYAQTRSLILDGDGDLADEYAFDEAMVAPLSAAGMREWLPRDYDGRFRHYANIGIVVLFGPFLMAGHLVAVAASQAGLSVSTDGYDLPYVLGVAYGTSALVALGLMALVPFLRKHAGPAVIVVAGASIWLGSSLMWWTAFRPLHAHGASVLLECLFVAILLGRARDPGHRLAWFTLGVIGGLLMTVRPVAAVYQVVPAAWLVVLGLWASVQSDRHGAWRRFGSTLGSLLLAGFAFISGSLVGRLPQFVFTGDPSLAGSSYYEDSGYLDAVGTDLVSGLSSLLFDGQQGAAQVVPVVVLGLFGLAGFWRRDRSMVVACAIWASLIWGFVATLGYPERFGGPNLASRHLVEATPIYVIGAAGLLLIGADAGRAIGRRIGSTSTAPGRVGVSVAVATLVITATWGFLLHVAISVLGPTAPPALLERLATLFERPAVVGQLWQDGSMGAPFVLVGRAGAALIGGDRNAALAAAIAVVMLLSGAACMLLAGAIVVAVDRGGGAGRRGTRPDESSKMPSDRRIQVVGLVAWSAVAGLVIATSLPAFLRPLDEVSTGVRERTSWTTASPPSDGTVPQVVVGDSPYGNETLAPRSMPPDRHGPDEILASTASETLDEGLHAHMVVPGGWRSLAMVEVALDGLIPIGARVQLVGQASGSGPAVSSTVAVEGQGAGRMSIPMPIRFSEPGPSAIDLTLTASVPGVRAAILPTGQLAVRLHGIAPTFPAQVAIDGVRCCPFGLVDDATGYGHQHPNPGRRRDVDAERPVVRRDDAPGGTRRHRVDDPKR